MAKQKHKIEYRYYEVPSGHYVLALLGEQWEKNYGHDVGDSLHFHNYLEIGYCYWGGGELILDEESIKYTGESFTIIPQNIPHTTRSELKNICKWEFLYIDIENYIKNEMSLNRILPEEAIMRINKKAIYMNWSENPALASIIRCICEEYRQKKPYYKEAVKGYLRCFVAEMLRITEGVKMTPIPGEQRLNGYVEKSVKYIGEHYAEDIKMAEVADICGLSESHFRRIFEDIMQMKPLDYVNMVRIDKACEMIQKEDMAMEEVGFRVGYQTPSTFNRNFKKLTGKTPYQWKKEETHLDGGAKNYKISAKKGW